MSQHPPDGLFCQQCPYKQRVHYDVLGQTVLDLRELQKQRDHPTLVEAIRRLAVLTKPEEIGYDIPKDARKVSDNPAWRAAMAIVNYVATTMEASMEIRQMWNDECDSFAMDKIEEFYHTVHPSKAKPDLVELRKTIQESLKEVREATIAMAEGGEGATTVVVEVENIMDAISAMLTKKAKF